MARRPFKWTTKEGREQLRLIVTAVECWKKDIRTGSYRLFPNGFDIDGLDIEFFPMKEKIEIRTWRALSQLEPSLYEWAIQENTAEWERRFDPRTYELKMLRKEVQDLRVVVERCADA